MTHSLTPSLPPPHTVARCPFHDGAATLDLLLAELDPRDGELFDAALDLRSLATAGTDAAGCVEQLLRMSALFEERHYLAFYRVRCWARRAIQLEVRADRGSDWQAHPFPTETSQIAAVTHAALSALVPPGAAIPATARVRFTFRHHA